MANNVNWIQRSSVPSFAQMLKKNLPAQAPAVNLSSTVSTCCPYVEPDCGTAKVTQITGFPPITLPEPFLSEMIVPASLSSLPPRKVTKEFVVKYRHGDLNPVSALYQFAQMQRMEIDLKSTVTTDKRTFIHEKISSIIKETFTNLISKYPEYESCGSSLAAFVIEKGIALLWFIQSGLPQAKSDG
ncbi:adenosine deaminase domain-containing protein 1-like isoform X1 [Xenopus tropicalis]|uniref:Adenosine deaminase domain-containing protein 1-like isoform X1 n=1 Tax=Xenopus tropicalis TaxID=8364 RepID=A0A8J1JKZ1_XENTR|nr:adenosine deaminase domain-containing protein 1-like isoform X1 [Xenopus tropicalis]